MDMSVTFGNQDHVLLLNLALVWFSKVAISLSFGIMADPGLDVLWYFPIVFYYYQSPKINFPRFLHKPLKLLMKVKRWALLARFPVILPLRARSSSSPLSVTWPKNLSCLCSIQLSSLRSCPILIVNVLVDIYLHTLCIVCSCCCLS